MLLKSFNLDGVPKIRLFLNLLLTIEVGFGITLLVVTFYYQHILSTFMTEVESEMLSAKFFNTYVLGFQLIASYFCGMALWSRIWLRRYTENIQLLLGIWLFFCFLIVICGCATIWSLQTSGDALAESAELMLYKGIDIYYINPEWKLLWDQLQYLKGCCGVHNYQDWMYAAWMPQNVKKSTGGSSQRQFDINDNNGQGECSKPSEGEQSFAPYACCKLNSTSCFENYVPRTEESSSSIPHLNISDINTEGCLALFTDYMWRVMDILCILMFSAILVDVSDEITAFQIVVDQHNFQIIICCLTKYLMRANECLDYCTMVNDMSMYDDEGNALVVIKCPPNVKCITLEEQKNSDLEIDSPNFQSGSKPCVCFAENNDRRPCSVAKEKCGQQKNHNSYILH